MMHSSQPVPMMDDSEADSGQSEFHRIARYFAPLSAGASGALNLTDDAAILTPDPDRDMVISVDTLVEGVHFLGNESACDLARKVMRVNLSDLAAMGARPHGYFLSMSIPSRIDDDWIARFCDGLAKDQSLFDWHLMGGDSTGTSGPISLTITALGQIATGAALLRSGARAGDALFVSGSVGDGYLGLQAAQGLLGFGDAVEWLAQRYRMPEPRIALGTALVGRAHAVMDISDGLVADLEHLCRASGVAATVEACDVPISDAAADILADDPALYPNLLTGGDDYELLIAGPADAIVAAAQLGGVPVTRIGAFRADVPGWPTVIVRSGDGEIMEFDRTGFRHA